jgi:hypothetical protein
MLYDNMYCSKNVRLAARLCRTTARIPHYSVLNEFETPYFLVLGLLCRVVEVARQQINESVPPLETTNVTVLCT